MYQKIITNNIYKENIMIIIAIRKQNKRRRIRGVKKRVKRLLKQN